MPAGVGGEHIAFIDDRRENLEVAKRFGMTTIHYQREPDQCAFEPDYTISSLGEVLQIFHKDNPVFLGLPKPDHNHSVTFLAASVLPVTGMRKRP